MTGLDWDDPLPLNISKKVTNCLEGLETLSSFQVPRCLQCPEEVFEVTFHVFLMTHLKRFLGVLFIKDPFTNLARFQQIWSCQNQKSHHCSQQPFQD